MGIPSLAGFDAGELVTAAKLTDHTKTAIESAVYYKPFCHIRAAATQQFASNATVQHVLNAVVADTDSMADLATYQIVINTPGRYRVDFGNAWDTNTVGVRYAFLYTDTSGTPIASHGVGANSGFIRTNASWVLYCAAGDRLELRGNQNSGGSLNARTDYGGCFLMAEWISM